MVNLLPCLSYPDARQFGNRKSEIIWLAFSAYFCSLMFLVLFAFAVHNTWQYLIKQHKWRLFSLRMFYVMTLVCSGMRIWVNVDMVCTAQHFDIALTLYPAILKMCIGIIQVFAMIEITIKVRESVRILAVLNQSQQRKQAKNLIKELIAGKKRVDRKVIVSQVFVFVLVLVILVWSLVRFVLTAN